MGPLEKKYLYEYDDPNILEEKDRMEYMHKLDELATYYYTRLDKGRLRDNILAILNNAGVEI